MLVLPTIIIALGSISGAGGIALAAKGAADTIEAGSINRQIQLQNDKNLMRFYSVSDILDGTLKDLGKQRAIISKNFIVFANAYEMIRNRPTFSKVESPDLPKFDFDEVKNVAVLADSFLAAGAGAAAGTFFSALAVSGTTSAVMALGTASTGIKIAELSGAAAQKAMMACLGGGALSAKGGGIALGTLVLNTAALGVGVLFEGIALAYAGSLALKQANEVYDKMLENEHIITNAIKMQLEIAAWSDKIKNISVDISNNVYKPLVLQMKELVSRKQDFLDYSADEKKLVENTILIVQILHYINNIPLYKVTKLNEKGEAVEVEANTEQVSKSIKDAKNKTNKFRR